LGEGDNPSNGVQTVGAKLVLPVVVVRKFQLQAEDGKQLSHVIEGAELYNKYRRTLGRHSAVAVIADLVLLYNQRNFKSEQDRIFWRQASAKSVIEG